MTVARYRLSRNYASKTLGPWLAGAVIELEPEQVLAIERHMPGTLELVGRERSYDAPPHDRMMKRATQKRGQGEGQ